MGLTSAMLTAYTGIKSNQYMMDSIGDNVANVNTTGFKNQRTLFETLYYQTIRGGTAPSETSGGTNPVQVGHGSTLASIQRNFTQGSIQDTGVKSDLAIDGAGFFILNTAAADTVYTRDGSFQLNQANVLVSADGSFVQGFASDENGDIIPGVLTNLQVPLGTESEAVATTEATLVGNLDADSTIAGSASVTTSAPLLTSGGTAATATTALTSLVDESDSPLFNDGDVITVSGVQRGGIDLPSAEFTVGTDGSTVGDFASFLEATLAINTDPTTGGTPGVTISAGPDPEAGSLVVTSNLGLANAITLTASNIRNTTTGTLPFTFSETTAATGEGVSTGLIVFDSLGNPVEIRVRMAMESQSNSGTVWRFYAEAPGDSDPSPVLGTGTVTFDQNGQFVSATGTDIQVDLNDSGAVTPLAVTLDFSTVTGLATGSAEPTLVMASQDGYPAGTLIDYAIDENGIITGTFSNAQTRVFGQVALAAFANAEGLIGRSDNLFVPGANSGEAVVTVPQTLGTGAIRPGSLEQSNVELAREFIGLISASTGFAASSRVIRTADDLLQELLLLAR